MSKKQIKVGVNQQGGPPPGFEWNAWILACSQDEAAKFLNKAQYQPIKLLR